ncbi:hypothetical protein ABS772_07220 [Methylorubrum podarium]|uniref:Uncharacterized protein n=1 Tax=Methylorubrum podarium TaxID=200476 RepID=A0ABV1QK18_9HYPH
MARWMPALTCPYLNEMWAVLTLDRDGTATETGAAVMSDLSALEARALAAGAGADSLAVLAIFRKMATTQASAHWPPRIRGH